MWKKSAVLETPDMGHVLRWLMTEVLDFNHIPLTLEDKYLECF